MFEKISSDGTPIGRNTFLDQLKNALVIPKGQLLPPLHSVCRLRKAVEEFDQHFPAGCAPDFEIFSYSALFRELLTLIHDNLEAEIMEMRWVAAGISDYPIELDSLETSRTPNRCYVLMSDKLFSQPDAGFLQGIRPSNLDMPSWICFHRDADGEFHIHHTSGGFMYIPSLAWKRQLS